MDSFSLFNRLPAEIRRLIWGLYLENIDRPGLAIFNKGYKFQFMHLRSRRNEDLALEEFRPIDTRVLVQVPTPASLFVSREARDVSVSWLRQHGFEEEWRKRSRIWVRRYDSERDCVYMPPAEWRRFTDVVDGLDEESSQYPVLAAMGECIKHLALPAFNAYYSIHTLGSIMDWIPNLERISVIWDELPNPVIRGVQLVDDHKVQDRWELSEMTSPDEEARLCHTDPRTGRVHYETGELKEWQYDMDMQWATCEGVPDKFVDLEQGVVNVPYVHVKARKVLVDWA